MNSRIFIFKNLIVYLILFIFFLINKYLLFFNIFLKFKYFISYMGLQNEFKKIENFFNLCNNNKIKIIKKHKKIINPKISFICTAYNRGKFILRFLKSIQYQNFNNIEIIIIDDGSNDNTFKNVEQYKQLDQRILNIKNKKNKGTFISRNLGVLYSKGEYIIFPDPDDIISKNIINICYKYAEKYNCEMIRFNLYIKGEGISFKIAKNLEKNKIYQPKLSTYIFYGNNELQVIDCYISNKFVKKNLIIKVLNSLNSFYINIYMTFMEDSLINYMLYRLAESFLFIEKIGYFYIRNSQSITKNLEKISELRLNFIFYFLNFIYQNSKNIKYEKDMFNVFFTNLNKQFNMGQKLHFASFKLNFHYFYKIINIFIKNKFITDDNKNVLNNYKKIIESKIK